MKLIIDVDINNPIHHAEGTDYLMPDLHTYISENMLNILKEKGKVLPEKHGKLIDLDALIELYINNEIETSALDGLPMIGVGKYSDGDTIWKELFTEEYVPTIVEAEYN